ncbi:MAG: cbb3-type cytochrome c oxidase subunit 3 [Spongiibacteraceae bacterium]
MDLFETLRSIGTASAFIAFVGICCWAYSKKRKASFDEAANLPFADSDESGE